MDERVSKIADVLLSARDANAGRDRVGFWLDPWSATYYAKAIVDSIDNSSVDR